MADQITLAETMTAESSLEFEGKRALIEVREGRRWHRLVVATLKKEQDGLYAVFREAYPEHYPEPAKIKIPEKQLGHFLAVVHSDYDFRFCSVLYRIAHQSDDSCAGLELPVIVSHADIDAVREKEANQAAQHNAGSRPSSGDSASPATPSAAAPRG